MKKSVQTISAILVLILLTACAKQKGAETEKTQDPLPDTTTAETPADTVETADWSDVDTSSLDPVDVDSLVAANLTPIHFGLDEYALNDSAREKAIAAAEFLLQEKDLRVRVDGHCDERGSSEYNMALGEKRARAVKDILTGYGVNEQRLEISSFGKEMPAAYNCSEESCHQKNRRVEFTVIRK
ncbi:MAG: OmpA family protein [Fibrobacterota bacterium]